MSQCRVIDAAISGSNASGIIAGYLGIRAPKSSNYVGSIKNCFVSGSVSGNPAGGIVGMSGTAYSPYSCQIDNCYSSARVSASGHGGGIVGNMLDGGIVTNVYATGRVSADRACGGIAGNLEGSSYLQNVVAWNSSVSGPKDNTGLVSGTKKSMTEPAPTQIHCRNLTILMERLTRNFVLSSPAGVTLGQRTAVWQTAILLSIGLLRGQMLQKFADMSRWRIPMLR